MVTKLRGSETSLGRVGAAGAGALRLVKSLNLPGPPAATINSGSNSGGKSDNLMPRPPPSKAITFLMISREAKAGEETGLSPSSNSKSLGDSSKSHNKAFWMSPSAALTAFSHQLFSNLVVLCKTLTCSSLEWPPAGAMSKSTFCFLFLASSVTSTSAWKRLSNNQVQANPRSQSLFLKALKQMASGTSINSTIFFNTSPFVCLALSNSGVEVFLTLFFAFHNHCLRVEEIFSNSTSVKKGEE
mmetsp:Transcript_35894/g.56113  ORF Transcript_35894/g.56113 Transcript_35894/m.56113 type:complete len:243 (-) Transcript_35894:2251-2979(-)